MTAREYLQKYTTTKLRQEQAMAMDELEKRGFRFMAHFGTKDAVDVLAGMNQAMADGDLYRWLSVNLGMITR